MHPYLALLQRSDVTSAILGPAPVIGLCWGLRKDDIHAQHSDRLETWKRKNRTPRGIVQAVLDFQKSIPFGKIRN